MPQDPIQDHHQCTGDVNTPGRLINPALDRSHHRSPGETLVQQSKQGRDRGHLFIINDLEIETINHTAIPGTREVVQTSRLEVDKRQPSITEHVPLLLPNYQEKVIPLQLNQPH